MKLFEIAGDVYKTALLEQEALDMLVKNCSEALKTKDSPIIRGMTGLHSGFGVLHGAAGGRQSANTSNVYTTILDEILPPKGYPKRGASIICANYENRGHATGYGNDMFAIFPFDGVPIGICPQYDMWDTLITLGNDTRPIFRWNREFTNMGVPNDPTFEEVITVLKKMRNSGLRAAGFEMEYPWLYKMSEENIEKELRDAYAEPFKLATTSMSRKYNDEQKHELWIGGKCVAIQYDLYKSALAKINKT